MARSLSCAEIMLDPTTEFSGQKIAYIPMSCIERLDSLMGGGENHDWVDMLQRDLPYTNLGSRAWEYLRYIERYVDNGPGAPKLTQQTMYLVDQAGHLQDVFRAACQSVDDVYMAQDGAKAAMALLMDINFRLIRACAAIVKTVFIKADAGEGSGTFTKTSLEVALKALDWLYQLSEVCEGGFVRYAAQNAKLEKALDPLAENVLSAMRLVLNERSGVKEKADPQRDQDSDIDFGSASPASAPQVNRKGEHTGTQAPIPPGENVGTAVEGAARRTSTRKRPRKDTKPNTSPPFRETPSEDTDPASLGENGGTAANRDVARVSIREQERDAAEPNTPPQPRATLRQNADRPTRREETKPSSELSTPERGASASLAQKSQPSLATKLAARKKKPRVVKGKSSFGGSLGVPDWFEGRVFATVWNGEGNGRRVAVSDKEGALVGDGLRFFASRDERLRRRRVQ